MPFLASLGAGRGKFRAQQVDVNRYRLKVFGVDAMPDTTQVVEHKPIRRRMSQYRENEPVSLVRLVAKAGPAVAVIALGSKPQPASTIARPNVSPDVARKFFWSDQ